MDEAALFSDYFTSAGKFADRIRPNPAAAWKAIPKKRRKWKPFARLYAARIGGGTESKRGDFSVRLKAKRQRDIDKS